MNNVVLPANRRMRKDVPIRCKQFCYNSNCFQFLTRFFNYFLIFTFFKFLMDFLPVDCNEANL